MAFNLRNRLIICIFIFSYFLFFQAGATPASQPHFVSCRSPTVADQPFVVFVAFPLA
ncbi:hypothetical protein P167DRAFT_539406 [Morchella conica CCBAS932]|uniref:Uncharacterized protein n=1 Tax=Morchella conica CCBAS932 TaxID=1392247 RepID=A0A3N4KCU3_9PEZI|nr:hypothetical protein P167DRAFT_539406 [Morchella conica CCBAS932]